MNPVGKDNVPANVRGEACLGWTLADQPNPRVATRGQRAK
jgi:hypothetical protein